MAIPVDYFQPMTFQQANPLLSGIQAGQQIFGQGVQNAYLPSALSQQLQQMRLANAAQQIRNQYLAPQLSANIGLTQAQTGAQQALPGLYGAEAQEALARGGMFGAQGNLLRQETPYLVQSAQGDVYKDPILQRLFEMQKAQQTGAISPNTLGILGMGGNTPLGTNNTQNQAQQLPNASDPNALQFNDPAQNWALFGSPISPLAMMQLQAYGKGLDTQAQTGVTQYNDALAKASDEAKLANLTSNFLDQFQNAYDKSKYKGPAAGTLPVTGWHTLLMPGNLANEQAADNASQNIAALKAKMLAGGRVTNYELNYFNQLKPNRSMDPATAQMTHDFLKAKTIQMGEEQNFLNAAKNNGIDVQTANTLWNNYINQRPVYNFSTRTVNKSFQGSWNDYLTPEAISAARSGQNYVPLPTFNTKQDFQNWYNTLLNSDKATVSAELRRRQ